MSDENTILSVAGLTTATIPNLSSGPVSLAGKVPNVSVSFAHGDYLYVSKTGGLTNIGPEIGVDGFVAGDTVIRVGVICRNTANPLQKDILVKIQVVGKL